MCESCVCLWGGGKGPALRVRVHLPAGIKGYNFSSLTALGLLWEDLPRLLKPAGISCFSQEHGCSHIQALPAFDFGSGQGNLRPHFYCQSSHCAWGQNLFLPSWFFIPMRTEFM